MNGPDLMVALGLLVAVADTGRRLVSRGFTDGDHLDDPRSGVVRIGDGWARVMVQNWSGAPVRVELWFTSRPSDRYLRPVTDPLVKRTVAAEAWDAAAVGTVPSGEDAAWTVQIPSGATRLAVRLGGPEGRIRLHKHLLATAPSELCSALPAIPHEDLPPSPDRGMNPP